MINRPKNRLHPTEVALTCPSCSVQLLYIIKNLSGKYQIVCSKCLVELVCDELELEVRERNG